MPFKIVKSDIGKMDADVIVNSTYSNEFGEFSSSLSFGGAEGELMEKGGEALREARLNLGEISVSEVKVTAGLGLNCKYVIHVVGPREDEELLRKTYKNIFKEVRSLDVESIAIPFISTGFNGFDKELAFRVAEDEVLRFLGEQDILVYLVIYDDESYEISKELKKDIDDYLNTEEDFYFHEISPLTLKSSKEVSTESRISFEEFELEDGFVDTLMKFVYRTSDTDVDIYKRANIDRKLFSKIKNNKEYSPSKRTAIMLAIGLVLDIDDTLELLESAGFTLSNSIKFDKIVRFCIEREKYSIMQINFILEEYGEKPLGY